MISVTTDQAGDRQGGHGDPDRGAVEDAQLGVVVLHARDAAAATAGGADRLLLTAGPQDGHSSPDAGTVSAVLKQTDLPVWVALRTPKDSPADLDPDRPAHLANLVDLGQTYMELGVGGVAFGFLDRDLEVDRLRCAALHVELGGAPWVFLGFDAALDADHAWRDVRSLPGLEAVISAGSPRGLARGAEELIARARHDPPMASLLMAAGGLTPDQVPWLVRAGVRRFAIGSSARAGGSWSRGLVDPDRVRSWRMLLDDALARALGLPADD